MNLRVATRLSAGIAVLVMVTTPIRGPGSSVGIANGYGLDGPGSYPGEGEIFRTCPDRTWAHRASCTMGTGSFPGVESGRGVTLTPHPF
jgi:hypothetical protein